MGGSQLGIAFGSLLLWGAPVLGYFASALWLSSLSSTAYPVGLSLYHPLTSKCHCPALFTSPVFHPVSPTLATHLPAHQQPHQLLARTRGTPEHWVGGEGRCEPVSREIPQLLGWRPAGGLGQPRPSLCPTLRAPQGRPGAKSQHPTRTPSRDPLLQDSWGQVSPSDSPSSCKATELWFRAPQA